MPDLVKKSISTLIVIFILFLIAVLAGSNYFIAPSHAENANKAHPDNWMDTHGSEFFAKKWDCGGCHGANLDGGDSGYGCDMCHMSPKHPKKWSSKHGGAYRKSSKSCNSCHGKSLTGGPSKTSCTQCHMSPRHSSGWKSSHGDAYVQSPSKCRMCHNTKVESSRKVGCNKCHSSPSHPDNWMNMHGAEYTTNGKSCGVCHGQDLNGGSAKTTCNACHISPKHPSDWSDKHGAHALSNLDSCTSCHGKNLTGGKVGVGCDGCHINPKHPTGWINEHGTQYFDSKKQCQSCHGHQAFRQTSKKDSPCLKCHTSVENSQVWQPETNTNTFNVHIAEKAQLRTNRFGNREVISQHDLGFNIHEQEKGVSFTSQLRYSREWVDSDQNFDLYETNFTFDSLFNNHLSLVVGRQSIVTPVDYQMIDGIHFQIMPSPFFDVSVYSGIPRFYEEGDLDGEIGLVSGLSLILNEISYTQARLDFTYQKKNFTDNELNNTDKMYVAASVSKGLSIFRLYALGEYDITEVLPTTITVGSEIYPFTKKVGFLLEGNYFDESRNDNLDNIFTIFSASYLWQVKTGIFVKAIKNLNLYQNFSFQRYETLASNPENGFNAETGVGYFFDNINLDTDVGYYFIRSYGGTLHGVRLSLYEKWTPQFFSEIYVDYVSYSKITSDNDRALNAAATTGVSLNNGLSVSGVFEYVRNNVFAYDFRGIVRLSYFLNHRFRDWGGKK
ncbi:MAG: hypothetical protein ABII18_05125 [bacterium]